MEALCIKRMNAKTDRIKRGLVRVLALGAALFILGCSGSADRLNDNVLRIGNGGEPQDLDPHTVNGTPEVRIISALFEGLVTYHPTDDNIPYPGVATHWENSADGRQWDFFLRPEARWSNGDPLTADDFVFSWRRVLTPTLGNDYVDWLYIFENAEAYHRGTITDFATVGITAMGPHHLRLRTIEPVADFLKILLNHTFLPVHEATVTATGGHLRPNTGWTHPNRIVSNGAFRLVQWRPNAFIRVEPNPYYWDHATVSLDAIEFFPIQDENTEMRMFLNGQLHITNSLPVNMRTHFAQNRPDVLRADPLSAFYYYSFNTTRPPLDDPRVRHALALAIDREQIVRTILHGMERPARGIIPDGIGGFVSPQRNFHDPERARALLAEAGFPGGQGFPRLELLFNTSDNHRVIAEAIQFMWRQQLGIDVQLTNKEWKVFLDMRDKLQFDIARAGWVGGL